jgi:hydrogenase maturation protease
LFERPNPAGQPQAAVISGFSAPDCTGSSRAQGKLVLSLGNPLRGDDGVGSAILEALSASACPAENVIFLDGYRGGLLNALLCQDYAHVFVVDAALLGGLPGSWKRFTLDDAMLAQIDLSSCKTLHNASLAEALALAKALDIKLPEVVIYGVQPKEIEWSLSLSEPVRKVVPDVCAAILNDLGIT